MLFNPNALFELASKGMPNFAETMTDAKTVSAYRPLSARRCSPSWTSAWQDLDSALKRACEEFITESSSRIASPIRAFLDRCTAYLSSPSGKDLPAQPWATPDEVTKLHDDFQATVADQSRAVVDKLRIYLNDEKTIGVLLPPLLVSRALERVLSPIFRS